MQHRFAWCSAYGKTRIESTSKDIIEWEIKIEEDDGKFDDDCFGIGIISNYHDQNRCMLWW